MTYQYIPDPTYISAYGECNQDSEMNVVALAPNRTGYWWGGYQAAIPQSSGFQITVRLQIDGISANIYTGTADEGGEEWMYINHMGIHMWGGNYGLMGPGNALRAYASRGGHGTFGITLFLIFIPTVGYAY
jgi:hypothetical protein